MRAPRPGETPPGLTSAFGNAILRYAARVRLPSALVPLLKGMDFMYTRWRLYILALFLVVAAATLLFLRFLRGRGVPVSRAQAALILVGTLLTLETAIILTLSNFNLGVILPAFFGLPLILLAVLLPVSGGTALILKRVLYACYGLAAAIFLVCGVLMFSAQHKKIDQPADAVIVLGAAVHGDRVTWVLENRLNRAIEYLNANGNAVAVVSGGQGAGESVTEGSAMKKYMLEHGIAEDRVYAEERATNTSENFLFSKEIIDGVCGPDARLAFVTTDFHVFRAGRVANKLGIPAAGIPADDVWYLRLNNFMRESVGIIVYALRGQL